MKKRKIGLALGAGGARGLTHIGVLKVLHKHKIFPDYIAGTSMGAIVGAAYAAGHSPDELQQIVHTTQWKNMVDFTVPKAGLIKGHLMEKKIRDLVFHKQFNELNIPLKVVSYNLTKREPVIFDKGDVAKAVRASSSIPGIFAPVRFRNGHYVDGAVANPTPYDVVKAMGADIVIAVDLYKKEKQVKRGTKISEQTLMQELKEKFVYEELTNLNQWLASKRRSKLGRAVALWLLNKFLYPKKVLKIMVGKDLPEFTKVMFQSTSVMTHNLAQARLACAKIDVLIQPNLKGLRWSDFDKAEKFIALGEKAMMNKIGEIKKKLR